MSRLPSSAGDRAAKTLRKFLRSVDLHRNWFECPISCLTFELGTKMINIFNSGKDRWMRIRDKLTISEIPELTVWRTTLYGLIDH